MTDAVTGNTPMADAPSTPPTDRLPLWTAFGWGMGTLGVAAMYNAVNILLLQYLVDFVGIGAAVAGGLMALSKLYDAFTDPVIGAISDRSKSKMGRRRPFVLYGCFLLALSAILLFNVPSGLTGNLAVIYAGGALILYATAYGLFGVPYMAMPAEMTTSANERSRLISFRVLAVSIASLIATFVGPVVLQMFNNSSTGYSIYSSMLASLAIIGGLTAFFATRNAPFHYQDSPYDLNIFKMVQSAWLNKPFMLLVAVKLISLMTMAVTQAVMPFLFFQVLSLDSAQLGYYFLLFYLGMMCSQPVWLMIARKLGKRWLFITTTILSALVALTWALASPGDPYIYVLARGLAAGIIGGGGLMGGQSLLPDVMAYDFKLTGMRREGLLSAIYTLVEKFAFAMGTTLTGLVLGLTGYIKGTGGAPVQQPESVVNSLYTLIAVFPISVACICAVLIYFIRIPGQK
ncbi:MAG TPA: hypothetical protein DDZ43_06520 [Hyphomonadaceae bacterium]|nr:hypothetical protein [Hyphomonadaceae bacterium]